MDTVVMGRQESGGRAARNVLICFDRDHTVSTGNPPGPVDVETVRVLGEQFIVYAHGNQRLCKEANIAGVADLWDKAGYRGGPLVGEPRRNILRLLAARHPEADQRIVVDDEDLSDLEGWHYFAPWDLP